MEAIWYFVNGDAKEGLSIAFENEKYWKHAAIEVEKINGPILLLSAKNDEFWPSDYMSEKITGGLNEKQFKHYYQHFSFAGKHHEIEHDVSDPFVTSQT